HQFLTWMALDQATGFLWFVFYDRRNYNDNLTDVFMAVSKDGGQSFENFQISESPFVPNPNVFFGDYNNVTAFDNIVRPIWTRLHNSELSVWTALIDVQTIGIESFEQAEFSLYQNYPNPFSTKTNIKYKLFRESKISLKILNVYGQELVSLIENETRSFGRHIVEFDAKSYGLKPGIYLFSLVSEQRSIIKKMIVN
ncbi:MAG: T9SS type A sorting domain-containing protein, partial [Bacteroidota bacterium]|nr:T9SS type A sorting domain-containing protein [Bacteroidota bacterium]